MCLILKCISAKIRKNLSSYIISGYKIKDGGGKAIVVCNYRKHIRYFPYAEIEIKKIKGEFRFIRFVKNLDKRNNSLIIDLRENIGEQINKKCSNQFAEQILGIRWTMNKIVKEVKNIAAKGEDLKLKSIKKNHSALYWVIKRRVRGGWKKFLENIVFNYGDIVREFMESRELPAMELNKRIYKTPARDRYLELATISDTLTKIAAQADISISSAHRFLLEIKEYASAKGKSVDIEPKVGRPPVVGLLEEWARRRPEKERKEILSLPEIAKEAGVGLPAAYKYIARLQKYIESNELPELNIKRKMKMVAFSAGEEDRLAFEDLSTKEAHVLRGLYSGINFGDSLTEKGVEGYKESIIAKVSTRLRKPVSWKDIIKKYKIVNSLFVSGASPLSYSVNGANSVEQVRCLLQGELKEEKPFRATISGESGSSTVFIMPQLRYYGKMAEVMPLKVEKGDVSIFITPESILPPPRRWNIILLFLTLTSGA